MGFFNQKDKGQTGAHPRKRPTGPEYVKLADGPAAYEAQTRDARYEAATGAKAAIGADGKMRMTRGTKS